MYIDSFMLVFLSTPEFIFNIALVLVIAGKKEKLKFNNSTFPPKRWN